MATRLLRAKHSFWTVGLALVVATLATAGGAGGNPGSVGAQIKQAMMLLKSANRDYNGHRTQAMANLRQAAQILKQAHQQAMQKRGIQPQQGQQQARQQQGGQQGQQGQPQTTTPLSQAASDAQLRQATQILQQVVTRMQARGNKSGSAAAVPLLQQAIQQIQQGLAAAQQPHGVPGAVPR